MNTGPAPLRGAVAPDLVHAVETAVRAPSVHNTQPWRWQIGHDQVQLYADRLRHLAVTDPDGRDLLLSCGAALHHLRVALLAAGYDAHVQRLPDPEDRDLLATVVARPARPQRPGPTLAALAPAIEQRRTDRRRMSRTPVPDTLVAELVAAAAAEGTVLVPVTAESQRRRLLATLTEATVAQRRTPGYAAELRQWTRRTAGAHDGVPIGNVPVSPPGGEQAWVQRDFGRPGLAQAPARPGHHPGEDAATLLVLTSQHDTTLDRLQAGEALSAVLLTATLAGLATTPISQAVEVAQSRLRLGRDVLRIPEHPQLVLRVGYPATGTGPLPASPRRALEAVLHAPGQVQGPDPTGS